MKNRFNAGPSARERSSDLTSRLTAMDDILFNCFQQVIAGHTGLLCRNENREQLWQGILGRMKHLKLRTPEEYLELLATRGPAATEEWQSFIDIVTIHESYFFRDKEQFTLLRDTILPELLGQKKRNDPLSIWCAGCSTGEEPYSLAIVLDQLLPREDARNTVILGTDINQAAIRKACGGTYGQWSFRAMEPQLLKRYFEAKEGVWVLDERIRKMVTFRVCNLLADLSAYPVQAIHGFDLIICRNVFIYFRSEAISAIVARFSGLLKEGGYLLTGHGELHGLELGALRAVLFPESIIYKKLAGGEKRVHVPRNACLAEKKQDFPLKPNKEHPVREKPAPREYAAGPDPLRELENLFENGDYKGVIHMARSLLDVMPRNLAAYDLMARASANLGNYDMAVSCCRKALEIDVTSSGPYLLLAQLAELRNDPVEAKAMLKRAMYLAPASVSSYLELAAIYEREKEHGHARKMRHAAAALLASLPPETMVEPYRESAGAILENLKRTLG